MFRMIEAIYLKSVAHDTGIRLVPGWRTYGAADWSSR